MKFTTFSPKETQKIAAKFAQKILRQKLGKSAVVLTLSGNLGAGKTTFLQGFAKGLGIKEKVLSPTFVIIKKFSIPPNQNRKVPYFQNVLKIGYKNFYHIDCYRLESPKGILHLDFKKIIKNPENIVAIEWPEKISKVLPKNIIFITFEHSEKNERKIIFKM